MSENQETSQTPNESSYSNFMDSCSKRWELILFAVIVIVFIIFWWSAIYENDRDQVKSIEIKIEGLEQVAADTSQAVQSTTESVDNTATEAAAETAALRLFINQEVESLTTELAEGLETVETTDSLSNVSGAKIPYTLDFQKLQKQKLLGQISVDKRILQLNPTDPSKPTQYAFAYPDTDSNNAAITSYLNVADVDHYLVELELVLREMTKDNDMIEYGSVMCPKLWANPLRNNLYNQHEIPMLQLEFDTSPVKTAGEIAFSSLEVNDKESVMMLKYTSDEGKSTLNVVNIQLLDEFTNTTNQVTGSHFRVTSVQAVSTCGNILIDITPTDVSWRQQTVKSRPDF